MASAAALFVTILVLKKICRFNCVSHSLFDAKDVLGIAVAFAKACRVIDLSVMITKNRRFQEIFQFLLQL